MTETDKRNAKVIAAMREHTADIISDPVKLAAWVDKCREREAEFDTYMALERHEPVCHCFRCMNEFLASEEQPQ